LVYKGRAVNTMVVSGKLFLVTKPIPIEEMAKRLAGYRINEEPPKGAPEDFKFITEIKGLQLRGGSLKGLFDYDSIIEVYQHGNTVPVPKTYEAPFLFTPAGSKTFLTVVAKKWRANAVAKRLNDVIFVDKTIVPLSIPPALMSKLVGEKTEDQVVTFFDQLQTVEKLSLYGESLAETDLYSDFSKRGGIWYTVARSKRFDQVVGLGRNGVVVAFASKDVDKFFDLVEEEVIPVLSSSEVS